MGKRENKVCKCLILCAVAGTMLLNALDVQAGKAKEAVWVITNISIDRYHQSERSEKYTYDTNGMLIRSKDKHNIYGASGGLAYTDEYVNTYIYKDKKLDRIERKRYHNGEESDYGCGSSKFYYDTNKNIRKIKSRFYGLTNGGPPVTYVDTTAKYLYDGNNVVEIREKSIVETGGKAPSCTKKISYDEANRLKTFQTFWDGNPELLQTFRYDEKGFPFRQEGYASEYTEQSGRIIRIAMRNTSEPTSVIGVKNIKYKKMRVDKSYLKAIEKQQKSILGQLLIPTGTKTMDSPLFLEYYTEY